jgi:hypothetical protein
VRSEDCGLLKCVTSAADEFTIAGVSDSEDSKGDRVCREEYWGRTRILWE